jgi:predicted peroxiredoxin
MTRYSLVALILFGLSALVMRCANAEPLVIEMAGDKPKADQQHDANQSLRGKVSQTGTHPNDKSAGHRLQRPHLDDASFLLPGKATQDAAKMAPLQTSAAAADTNAPPPFAGQTGTTEFPAPPAFPSEPLIHSAPSATPAATPAPVSAPLPSSSLGKKIVVRMLMFRTGNHMQYSWEGARMANLMLAKGADVTVLLDMDAVRAADKGDTMNTEFEPYQGRGNHGSGRYTTPQDLLKQFTDNGGKLVASERWSYLCGQSSGAGHPLIAGTKLLSDEEIADLLIDPNITVIDY